MKKQETLKKLGGNKLIPHLYPHYNYTIHYTNLKFLIELGVEAPQIHQILTFKQKPFLKLSIDFNTQIRKEAKNVFEKDFFN